MADQNSDDSSLPKIPINVNRLPKLGNTVKLSIEDREIGAKESAALVKRLGVESVVSLEASLTFKPWTRDGVQVDGEINSVLYSQCPVTLNSVEQHLHPVFKAKFAPPQSRLVKPRLNDEGEMVIDFDSEDIPDIFDGETLDAWAIVMEYLILEIDYFARADNAIFKQNTGHEPTDDEKISPFAELRSLKK
ncbi:MAG: DUF177 domain-containing protein [Hyphomicrobiales bacterium]|nr:DUF177 domain-containing protein [Hyphomicrobiales bacterium]